jgi:two-component system CheB/CheR fusion protein
MENISGTGKETNRCRVLIIEDHDDIRTVLEMMIQAEGFEAACVASAEEALALATTFIPHVILSDISLPHMDGYELLVALRQLPGLESVPAIALTGLADRVGQLEKSGFEAFLSKPIDYDLLFKKIATLTENCRPQNQGI